MSKRLIVKISFLVIAIVLIACGRGYWSHCRLAENVKKDVAMGRYNRAFETLEGVKGSRYIGFLNTLAGKTPMLHTIQG